MDDYGVPSSVDVAGAEEGARYNVGLVSEWYDMGVDTHSFLTLLKPGDLVEFKREAYCHWAVFIGEHTLPSPNSAGDDEDFLVVADKHEKAVPADLCVDGTYATAYSADIQAAVVVDLVVNAADVCLVVAD